MGCPASNIVFTHVYELVESIKNSMELLHSLLEHLHFYIKLIFQNDYLHPISDALYVKHCKFDHSCACIIFGAIIILLCLKLS